MSERLRPQTGEPAGIKPRSFITRVLTAAVYAIVVIGAVLWGHLPTAIVFGAMSGLAAAEFYAMERRESRLPNEFFGVAAAAIMPLSASLWGLPGLSATLTALIAASLVWHTAFRRTRTADTAITLFGAVYTGFLLAYLVLVIRTFEAGTALALLLIVSVWANDVFAYLVGSTIGRHKLAPAISPKKSWEGFFAGAAVTIALWSTAPFFAMFNLEFVQGLLTGAAVALASLIGDLAESRMKREAGVKDSGTLLPGHGGFLDRLDSLILVCLVAYWVLWWGGVR